MVMTKSNIVGSDKWKRELHEKTLEAKNREKGNRITLKGNDKVVYGEKSGGSFSKIIISK